MKSLIDRIETLTGMSPSLQYKILWTLVTILALVAIKLVFSALIAKRISDPKRYRQIKRTLNYTLTALSIVILWFVWLGGLTSLGTFLGLVSAGLAIAMQDTIANMAGRAYILWLKPFKAGDRIEVNDTVGDVIDAGLFNFTMLEVGKWVHADQSTGRIVVVPNSSVLRHALHNYTAGFQYIWHEIPVLVTFESNWQAAKEILSNVASDMGQDAARATHEQIEKSARKFGISYAKLDAVVYTKVVDSGVLLTIRYLTGVRWRRSSEQTIWERILTEFKKRGDIDFAYPTRRFYDNAQEGKPDAGGPEDKRIATPAAHKDDDNAKPQ